MENRVEACPTSGDAAPEDNTSPGKTDHTMGNDTIVEAKRPDENRHADGLISHIRDRNAAYGVLTNGQKRGTYDADTTTKSPGVDLNIVYPDGAVLSEAIRLHRSVVMLDHNASPVEKPEGVREALPPEPEHPPGPGIALTALNYSKGDSPPKSLIHRKGSRKALGSWVDLLAGVAEWLINNGHLTARDCPVRLGSKNYLLHTEPTHPNGKPFSTHRQVGDLYVFTNFGPSDVIRHAKKLIEKAGLKPSDFKVDCVDSSRSD